MRSRVDFYLNRVRERLWVKPLAACALSVTAVFAAKLTNVDGAAKIVPEIDHKTRYRRSSALSFSASSAWLR